MWREDSDVPFSNLDHQETHLKKEGDRPHQARNQIEHKENPR